MPAPVPLGGWGRLLGARARRSQAGFEAALSLLPPPLPQVLQTGEEIKLQRNALLVLQHPTGNEVGGRAEVQLVCSTRVRAESVWAFATAQRLARLAGRLVKQPSPPSLVSLLPLLTPSHLL